MRFFTLIFLISLLFNTISFAQTTVPGGNVSGTWPATGSPYNVQGNITIQADSTLNIEPGVEVNFQGNGLSVYGSLQAIGTVTDSIYFFRGNIHIQHSSADFSYCSLRRGNLPIITTDSRVNISHCQISDNITPEGGGLIVEGGSHVTVSNSSILRNSALVRGAGIGVRDVSYLDISNSTISYNHLYYYAIDNIGGGIHAYSIDTLIVTNCIFSNNSAGPLTGNYSKGGAIGVEPWPSGGSGYVNISQCTFLDNSADYGGGAIYMDSCTAVLNHNYFKGNSTIFEGVALSVENSSVQVSHNIFDRNICLQGGVMNGVVLIGDSSSALFDHCNFYGNGGAFSDKIFILSGTSSLDMKNTVFSQHPSAFTMQFNTGSQVSVEYSNFYNSAANFIGSVPTGLGTISGVNANGDPCDAFHNIFLDPLFANPDSGDFHLSWANWPVADSTKSPCIDAGDPSSSYDPDSTVTDMGAFYFNQLLITVSDTLLDFGIVDIGQQMDLPLTIRNDGTTALRLQNVSNQYSAFTHNWNPADSLILPNDSLTITVTFTPVDTNLIIDTLLIENSDRPLQVQLSGKGKIVVGIEDQTSLPKVYALYPAYPNPFNPATTISFDLPKSSKVILKVFNILGEEVATIVSDRLSAGSYLYDWDAGNLASGVYIYRLEAEGFVQTRKMILMK